MKLTFLPQHRIGPILVDAFLPEHNIVIEVQGDFFHCNPAVYPNGPTCECQRQKVGRDRNRFSFLRNRDYRIVEVWEKDIRELGAEEAVRRALPIGIGESDASPT